MSDTYFCNLCKTDKPEDEFSDTYKNGRGRCRECKSVVLKQYAIDNPDKVAQYRAKRKAKEQALAAYKKEHMVIYPELPPRTKVCTQCRQLKSFDEYNKHTTRGLRPNCKLCSRKVDLKYISNGKVKSKRRKNTRRWLEKKRQQDDDIVSDEQNL